MTTVSSLIGDILRTFLDELSIPVDPTAEDAGERETLKLAVGHTSALSGGPPTGMGQSQLPQTDIDHWNSASIALQTLIFIAREKVRDIPWNLVTTQTLQLYTDASVLLAVLHFLEESIPGLTEPSTPTSPHGASQSRAWYQTIKLLDKAIIVGGAKGPGRAEWIHQLLSLAQPFLNLPPAPMPPRKRRRVSVEEHDEIPLFAPAAIPSIPPPKLSTYASNPDLYAQPFILRGYIDWPALEIWRSGTYLLDATGERYVPVEVGGSYDMKGWGQRILPWRRFLKRAGWGVECAEEESESESESGEDGDESNSSSAGDSDINTSRNTNDTDPNPENQPLYLAQTALFTQFPALERDFSTPEYVLSSPQLEGYTAPPTPLVNVWVGSGGKEIVSPAHTDPYFNCYVQVLGRKRVWVAPPGVRGMAAYGSKAEPVLDASEDGGDNLNGECGEKPRDSEEGRTTASDLASEYMTNTSRVPLFRADMDTIKRQHPAFVESAFPLAREAVLQPGDMLVLPPRWWHSMQGEGDGPCWSVSFWY